MIAWQITDSGIIEQITKKNIFSYVKVKRNNNKNTIVIHLQYD
jgi:hypothetical protein